MNIILDKIMNAIISNWKLLLITILSIFFIDYPNKLFQTLLIIAGFELFALQIYEYIIRFVTSNKFLKSKFDGGDSRFTVMETVGFSTFQAAALLSSHLMVAIVGYSIYLVQFAPPI